jgi:hypothetical protein
MQPPSVSENRWVRGVGLAAVAAGVVVVTVIGANDMRRSVKSVVDRNSMDESALLGIKMEMQPPAGHSAFAQAGRTLR